MITHSLMELSILAPQPAVFVGFLWKYKVFVNESGVLEDYRVIITDSQGANLAKAFTVFHTWEANSFTVDIDR